MSNRRFTCLLRKHPQSKQNYVRIHFNLPQIRLQTRYYFNYSPSKKQPFKNLIMSIFKLLWDSFRESYQLYLIGINK